MPWEVQQGAVGGSPKHRNIKNDKSNHIGSPMNWIIEKDVKKGRTYSKECFIL